MEAYASEGPGVATRGTISKLSVVWVAMLHVLGVSVGCVV